MSEEIPIVPEQTLLSTLFGTYRVLVETYSYVPEGI